MVSIIWYFYNTRTSCAFFSPKSENEVKLEYNVVCVLQEQRKLINLEIQIKLYAYTLYFKALLLNGKNLKTTVPSVSRVTQTYS